MCIIVAGVDVAFHVHLFEKVHATGSIPGAAAGWRVFPLGTLTINAGAKVKLKNLKKRSRKEINNFAFLHFEVN